MQPRCARQGLPRTHPRASQPWRATWQRALPAWACLPHEMLLPPMKRKPGPPPLQSRATLLAARPKGRGKPAWLRACKALEGFAEGEPARASPPLCVSVHALRHAVRTCYRATAAASPDCRTSAAGCFGANFDWHRCRCAPAVCRLTRVCPSSLAPRCSRWRLHRRHQPAGLP